MKLSPREADGYFAKPDADKTGLLIYGCREWDDYAVSADVTPHLASRAGIAVRVQGMRRHYSLQLLPGRGIQLIAQVDDEPEVMASLETEVALGTTWTLEVSAHGSQISARARSPHGELHELEVRDTRLREGALALTVTEGRTATDLVELRPI